jgi:pSer/pThr/pTyr-binding forkhead associated (FHA) protein
MIVYCEECGAKNILDDNLPLSLAEPIHCQFCRDVLVIYHHKPAETSRPAVRPLVISRLILEHQGITVEHPGFDHEITMGRHTGVDIKVQDERVSRLHARILYKEGKYCLIDQSLNGTYILVNNRHGRTIKRKEIMLVGQGIIGLGNIVQADSPNAIHYEIRSY